jgi:hypothetical protein
LNLRSGWGLRRLLALFRSCSSSTSSGRRAISFEIRRASSLVSRLSWRWRSAARRTHEPVQGHWHHDPIAARDRHKSPMSRKAALRHAASIRCAGRNGLLWGYGHRVGAHGRLLHREPLMPGRIENSMHRTTFSGRLTSCLDRFVITISVPLCSLGLSDWLCLWGSCCPSLV